MIELIVSDMRCDRCADAIRGAVSGIDPAAATEMDIVAKWVRIQSRQPAARFASAIAAEGLDAVIWWDGSPAPLAVPARRAA